MTENIHTHARSGTLTLENLNQLLIEFEVTDVDAYGDTALDVAIRHGQVSAVKLLLQAKADANRVTADGKTPLYAATQAPNSGRIVELLLKHGAKPDEPVSDPKGDTPLLSAIRQGASPEAVAALVKAGAALDKANELGETPKKLAEKSTNTAILKALRPKDETPDWKPELENFLVSSGLFALAYFKNFKDVGLNAINRVAALSDPEPGQISNPRTAEDFKNNLEQFINKKGLEDFYPPGSEYVAQVANNAVKILNDPSAPSATPQNVNILARQALYKPIFYLDDSGSMDKDNRMPIQAAMVQRMAKAITRATPEDATLVDVRFINKSDKFNDIDPNEVEGKLTFTPAGSTKLGTNLKDKVLNDFLYGPVNSGNTLKRPLLILTVTDGCPNEEPTEQFENEIKASLDFVKANGYGEEAVRYNLSQVGNADEATNFLANWLMNDLVPQNVNVTAEHLDDGFENFRQNDDDIDNWTGFDHRLLGDGKRLSGIISTYVEIKDNSYG